MFASELRGPDTHAFDGSHVSGSNTTKYAYKMCRFRADADGDRIGCSVIVYVGVNLLIPYTSSEFHFKIHMSMMILYCFIIFKKCILKKRLQLFMLFCECERLYTQSMKKQIVATKAMRYQIMCSTCSTLRLVFERQRSGSPRRTLHRTART